jgi:serine phosphatase RsbU (regulator of sigma subunit)
MRRNINIVQQNQFVAEMNKQFAALAANHQFATAVVWSFFSPTRRLTLCNAGHPEPLCLQRHDGQWTSISQPSETRELSDFPLGVLDDASYTQTVLKLSGGDLVLLFSDAFVEAVDANGDLLGADGLLTIIRSLEAIQPDRFIPALIDAIRDQDSNNLSDDDATVMLIRATGTRPSMKNSLLAPFRMLRRARDRTELSM